MISASFGFEIILKTIDIKHMYHLQNQDINPYRQENLRDQRDNVELVLSFGNFTSSIKAKHLPKQNPNHAVQVLLGGLGLDI